jgi:hypothetical protein
VERPVLPPGDAERVFGGFTNDAYTPAGTLERSGFFWRQVTRRRGHDWRSVLSLGLRIAIACALLLAVVGPIAYGLWNAFH